MRVMKLEKNKKGFSTFQTEQKLHEPEELDTEKAITEVEYDSMANFKQKLSQDATKKL